MPSEKLCRAHELNWKPKNVRKMEIQKKSKRELFKANHVQTKYPPIWILYVDISIIKLNWTQSATVFVYMWV